MRHRGCRPCARIRGSQYPASPAAGPRPPSDRDSRGRVPRHRSSSSRARPRRRFPRSSVRRGRRGTSAHCGRYIVTEICLGMRVALKIAYDGGAFFGHQRQPDRRTVEGECLAALRSAKVLEDAGKSFFRSASRTDRGVSAIGNVIAFDTSLSAEAVIGAFNDRARDVWAWAAADVAESFHPRHAIQRWYRYHLFRDLPLPTLRRAAALFVGEHDFRSFTSDPAGGRLVVDRIAVSRAAGTVVIDIRAASFRRGMVRRIVSAAVGVTKGLVAEREIRAAL